MDSKAISKLTKRRHPRYEEMVCHWDFLEACYIGGRAWFNRDNIFRYMKEGEREYCDRLKRAYRFNHSREVVDLVNKYLFRATVARKAAGAPTGLKKFWKVATLGGLDINEFMQIASAKSSIFGKPWIIVDSDVRIEEEGVVTQADAEKFQGPYVYLVRPQDMLDMAFDDKGNLLWVLVREYKRDDVDPLTSTGEVRPQYRLWTQKDWTLVAKRGRNFEVVGQGDHDLGEVPALPADTSFSLDPYVTPALIADIAYLDRACANYASNLDAIIQDQTFSQLAMPAQGVLPGDDVYNKMLEMGTKRVFLYDGEGGSRPEYLSPDPKQAQLIINAIQQLINEIYHCVGMAGERTKQDNAKGIDNSSGVAKSKDFERVVALLKSKATCLETVENRIARLVCKWNGETHPDEDLVEYSNEFDVKGLADEIEVTLSVITLNAPESVLAEQMKILIRKLLPHLGEEELKKMDTEADEWAKDQKEKSDPAALDGTQTGKLLEEARRNRTEAGEKQSATKRQETVA